MFACAHLGAVGEFAASRHGVITRTQAAALGIHRSVIARLKRDGHVVEPLPGVLVIVGSVATWRRSLMVATSASRGVGAAGFRASAQVHALDGYESNRVELLVP